MAEAAFPPDLAGFPLEDPGIWAERRSGRVLRAGLPALFLDRDGTVNVRKGYLGDPANVELRDEIVPAVRAANTASIPVVLVTNQSGIARGYFGWADFAAVNARLFELLAARGGSVDLVMACAYHQDGQPPYAIADHPMRKPRPGMFFRAAELLRLDLRRSIVVGDMPIDMEAGHRAGLAAGWLVGPGLDPIPGFPVGSTQDPHDSRQLLATIASLGAG